MNKTNWIRLERWYNGLHGIQQWSVKIGLVSLVTCVILVVTREPHERPRQTHIILNCDHCGTDPERSITYNEYMDQKEQQQQVWFREAKQQIKQDIWNEKGRERWCRNHPQDRNCK